MSNNPLQQYFRQPRIFISLPSKGVYSMPGSIQGNVENLPVYGMTGMDEIIARTPDALFTGESTIRLIQSCIPSIVNGWEVSNIDLDLILVAIKIATYGELMDINTKCTKCGEENSYEFNLTSLVDYYTNCKYENTVQYKDLTVKLRPLTYKQVSDISIKNLTITKQLAQAANIADEIERTTTVSSLMLQVAELQKEVFSLSVESVQVGNTVVESANHISEWVANTDKEATDAIKKTIEKNKTTWESPAQHVKCTSCNAEYPVSINLDQSSFFG